MMFGLIIEMKICLASTLVANCIASKCQTSLQLSTHFFINASFKVSDMSDRHSTSQVYHWDVYQSLAKWKQSILWKVQTTDETWRQPKVPHISLGRKNVQALIMQSQLCWAWYVRHHYVRNPERCQSHKTNTTCDLRYMSQYQKLSSGESAKIKPSASNHRTQGRFEKHTNNQRSSAHEQQCAPLRCVASTARLSDDAHGLSTSIRRSRALQTSN
jgi:hypothetical protein